jgi:hypothetical protein
VNQLVKGLEDLFAAFPLSLLEVWGQFGYLVGLALAALAFGGFTLRPVGRWGLGLERQVWDAKVLLSIPVTFGLIFITGCLGSFIVLVPRFPVHSHGKQIGRLFCRSAPPAACPGWQ